MATPPSEWDLVSSEARNDKEPFFPGVLRAPGSVGKQTDRACRRAELGGRS